MKGRIYEQRLLQRKIERPHIERTSFPMRDPFAVQPNQLCYTIEEQRCWYFWHRKPCGRTVKPGMIVAWTKQCDPFVDGSMCLETFENRLPVVESTD